MRHAHVSAKKIETILASVPKTDPANLKTDFDAWPSLARSSWENTNPPQLERSYTSILFAGMGGSGIVGDVIADLGSEIDSVRIDVLKEYHLPKYYTSDTLVVGISCSGNTEETISVLSEASKRGLDICTFGSGGLLEKFSSSSSRARFTKTQMLKVPRSSFPGLFYPVLKFLMQNGYLRVAEEHVLDSIECLSRVQDLCSRPSAKQNKPLEMASELTQAKEPVPIIYSSRRTRAVGLRFRQSLNENSKIHAFEGLIPEVCHNDIDAWGKVSVGKSKGSSGSKQQASASFYPVSLRLEDDPLEIKTRFQIVEDILKKYKEEFAAAPSLGNPYLSRILSMLYFLDYASYYAAIFRRVDPIQTPSIEYLKSELKTRLNFLSRIMS
jgi:glucose/mannose-6-phosphate isomerase